MNKEYDFRTDCYYWTLEKQVEENMLIERLIEQNFVEYLSKQRERKRFQCLVFLFINLFSLLEGLDDEDLDRALSNQRNIEVMNELGFGLRFSRSKKKSIHYVFGSKTISHDTLKKTLNDLQKLDFVLNVRNGFSCFNKGGASSQYKLGLTFFNWKKIYELYQRNFFDNHLNESYEPSIIIKKPVFIKKKRSSKKVYEPTNEYDYLIDEKEELIETKKYLQRLYDMYSSMKVSLNTYKNASRDIQERIDDLVNEQRYKKERSNPDYVYQLDYNSEVKKWNKYLLSPKKPKRIYHYDNDSFLSWGRIYGNFIDNIPNIYKPLLLINDEESVSIDIKSTILQLYVLNYHKDVPNKQDFYEYEGLKGILNREDVKLLSQCLNYNESLGKALVSYNHSCLANYEGSKMLKKNLFEDVICIMKDERPYLFDLFMNTDLNKQMIHQESCFIQKVSSKLMDKGIKHILNFDAVYTTKSNFKETLNLFEEVSINLYGRPINIDWK